LGPFTNCHVKDGRPECSEFSSWKPYKRNPISSCWLGKFLSVQIDEKNPEPFNLIDICQLLAINACLQSVDQQNTDATSSII